MTVAAPGALSRGFDRPAFAIDIQDGRRTTRLAADYMHLLRDVSLHQVWDGADELSLTFHAYDDRRRLKVIGERILEPGTSLLFRAGYGVGKLPVLGRFTVGVHEPAFGTDEPTVIIRASDGFARFVDNRWPSDLGSELQTYTDAAKILARKYGMGFAADVSRAIPHRTKKRRRRVRRKDRTGKVTYKTRRVRTKMIKNAGDEDSKFIKHLSFYAGFAHPAVRYIEPGSQLATRARLDHAVVEGIDGRDVLFFRRVNVRRQAREAGAYVFDYNRRDGLPTVLQGFDPRWDTDNVPVAVRVSGRVPGRPPEILTVEAELVGPNLIRERSALLRQAARAKTPEDAARLKAKAAGLAEDVAVTKVRRRRFKKRDKKIFGKNAETAILDVLEKEQRPGYERDPRRRRKVQTLRREVLRSTLVVRSADELQAIAKRWLQQRLQLHITATATVANAPGLELLYPYQIHEFRQLAPEYDGFYMVMVADHTWSSEGHAVGLSLERVAEAPSRLTATARSRQPGVPGASGGTP